MHKIDLKHLKELEQSYPDLLRIDIRSHEEMERTRLDNFKHIPFELLDIYFTEKKSGSSHIVLLCEDGERSNYAAAMLNKILPGIHLYILENGISDFE